MNQIGKMLHEVVDDDAQLIFGASVDQTLPSDEIVVTLVATGFLPPPPPPPPRPPPLDLFAYHPPQPRLQNTDTQSVADDAMERYAEYLDARAGLPSAGRRAGTDGRSRAGADGDSRAGTDGRSAGTGGSSAGTDGSSAGTDGSRAYDDAESESESEHAASEEDEWGI